MREVTSTEADEVLRSSLCSGHVCTSGLVVGDVQLVDVPVLEGAVGQVSPYDHGDLPLAQLLHGDLERVRLTAYLG